MKKYLLLCFLLFSFCRSFADFLIVTRSANLKIKPSIESETIAKIMEGDTLMLLNNGSQKNGYYHAKNIDNEGWIYRTLVRRYSGAFVFVEPENNISEIPVAINGKLEQIHMPSIKTIDKLVVHEGYISCMSTTYNVPKWVYHKISYSLLQGENQEREVNYPQDPDYPQLKTSAYAGSGYDHGHLAPAADFKRDEAIYAQSFYMTNMSPQHGCFNQKGWCLLESNVRKWALDNPASEFYIFSGSVFGDEMDVLCLSDGTAITVPSSFFKVIAERKNGKFIRGTAFLIENNDIDGKDIETQRTNIDEIERITGVDFFPQLNKQQEKEVEKNSYKYTIEDLKECPKRNTPCDKVYGKRVFPEERSKLICK